jgi:hypothetical protein
MPLAGAISDISSSLMYEVRSQRPREERARAMKSQAPAAKRDATFSCFRSPSVALPGPMHAPGDVALGQTLLIS